MVFSLSGNALAIDTNETENNVEDIVSSQPIIETDNLLSDDGVSTMSIENPVKAYMAVNTYSYAAPSSATGHTQEIIPGNTDVWVVEKVWCDSQSKYYFYVGYTYNSESHRGYVPSENVYKNGSRYLPENVPSETKPAGLKVHTSLAGTVYDGPATTYSVTGSVGQESIKLIRTEGDYNFIEYTVTATGKLKRGFLHHSLITGSWENLTANIANDLDGSVFYIKSSIANQYWSTVSEGSAQHTRLIPRDFSGTLDQLYKFTYDSAGKFFYIQPALGYANGLNRRVAVRATSGTEHPDRWVFLKNSAVERRQQFWVVKMSGSPTRYKILPRSSYGTMTVTIRSGYLNQYYTSSAASTGSDIWMLEQPRKTTTASRFEQDKDNWCWAAATKSAATSETVTAANISQSQAVYAIKGNTQDQGGSLNETAKAANYYIDDNKNSGNYTPLEKKIYNQYTIRRHIYNGHAFVMGFRAKDGTGHMLTLFGFAWVDKPNGNSPGHYSYYYYDSLRANHFTKFETYDTLINNNYTYNPNKLARWVDTVAYSTIFVNDTISVNWEEDI